MSEFTISMQENEVLVVLDYEIEVLCVVQWTGCGSSLTRLEFEKYHEAINLATVATFTPRTFMLRSVAAVLDRAPDKDLDVGRVICGWGVGELPVLLPCEDDGGTDVSDERKCKESLKAATPFVSRGVFRVSAVSPGFGSKQTRSTTSDTDRFLPSSKRWES